MTLLSFPILEIGIIYNTVNSLIMAQCAEARPLLERGHSQLPGAFY